MGSMITLGIGKFEIDWGKNSFFNDHSQLFLPSDVKQIPYYYIDGNVEEKEGFSSRLEDVNQRLNLLGYSERCLEEKFAKYMAEIPEYHPILNLKFTDFKKLLTSIDIDRIPLDDEYPDYDPGEYVSRYLFRTPEFKAYLPSDFGINKDAGLVFENLDPYFILKLLAINPINKDKELEWRFADIVENGWVKREDIIQPLSDSHKILIVTEGSSDAFIIKHALEQLRPRIADFFYFVDMEENYPFTGAGNLYRFYQGLSRIRIQNKVLVLFDNDAAGLEKFNLALEFNAPKNLHICKLPNHDAFSKCQTIGPDGVSPQDLNGRAVAIENFLDLHSIDEKRRLCRWTSYNQKVGQYQGELEGKDDLVRAFKNVNLINSTYDSSKLEYLLDYLVEQCVNNLF